MKALRIAVLAALPVFAGKAAAGAPEPFVPEPFVIAGSEVREISSSAGEAYRIAIARPEAPAPVAGYPVLYVLDGEDHFTIAAETARRLGRFAERSGVTPGLVVAISHPVGNLKRRAYDYTPPTGIETDPMGNPVGGADRFLDFILDELRPMVAADYPVDPTRQAIFGHSYGGLFVLHALFTRPESFRTYIASSPSLWFADGHILTEEAAFAGRPAAVPAPRTLVLTVGEEERGGPGGQAGLVDGNRAMAARLAKLDAAGLTVRHAVFDRADHGTASLPAIGLGLPHAFAPPSRSAGRPQQ